MLLARVMTILPLSLPDNRTFYAPFGVHHTEMFMLDQYRGHEASQGCVQRHFIGDTRARKLKGKV